MSKKKVLTGTIDDYPFVEVKWFDTLADNSWMSVDNPLSAYPRVID